METLTERTVGDAEMRDLISYGNKGTVKEDKDGNRYYYTYRKEKEHKLRILDAYGISTIIFKALKEKWQVDAIIMIIDRQKVLYAPYVVFEEKGEKRTLFKEDEQIFLSEKYFQELEPTTVKVQ